MPERPSVASCAYVGIQALVTAIPDGLIPRQAVIRLNVPCCCSASASRSSPRSCVAWCRPCTRPGRSGGAAQGLGQGIGRGLRRRRLSSALVVAEVALSLVLLAGAGLLDAELLQAPDGGPGLRTRKVSCSRVWPCRAGQYRRPATKRQLFRQVLERVQGLPGVVRGDDGQRSAALWRHSHRDRGPGKTDNEKVVRDRPAVQRGLLRNAGPAPAARAAAVRGGGRPALGRWRWSTRRWSSAISARRTPSGAGSS